MRVKLKLIKAAQSDQRIGLPLTHTLTRPLVKSLSFPLHPFIPSILAPVFIIKRARTHSSFP